MVIMVDAMGDRVVKRRSVFISSARTDNALCDRYVDALVARGFDVWYDRTNLQAGDRLSVESERQLQRRKALIVLLSPTSVASYWVSLETNAYFDLMADDLDRVLIPVRIAPCAVPPLLRTLPQVDASDKPFDKVIDAIVAALDAPPRPGGLAAALAMQRGVSRRTMLPVLAGTAVLSMVVGGAFTVLATRSGFVSDLGSINWVFWIGISASVVIIFGGSVAFSQLIVQFMTRGHRSYDVGLASARLTKPVVTSTRVFISYSRNDRDLVGRLKKTLMNAGADVWLDHERLPPGTANWHLSVRQGIIQAAVMIYVASETAAVSPYVIDEITIARNKGKTVIPFWIRGKEWHDCVPLGWGVTQYTDGRGAAFMTGVDELLHALNL